MWVLATAGSLWAQSAPIERSRENPRYFSWQGHTTVLVTSGEHYGSVINPDFDYVKYLDVLQSLGLNYTRIFLGDYCESPDSFGIENNTLAPTPGRFLAPWARSDSPGNSLGGNKFNLDNWDPNYFKRLHGFFSEAERRGIVVEAVLFFIGPGYDLAPLNPKNNINSTTAIEGTRYLTLDNGNLLVRQEQYVRKLVSELNKYPNLIYNICNEPWFNNQANPGFASMPPVATKEWIQRASSWVADEEARLPLKHLMGVDLTNQEFTIDNADLSGYFAKLSILNVHYDANAALPTLNPGQSKIWSFNETGFNGLTDRFYRTQGWNFLLSGGGVYSNLDFSFSVGHEDGTGRPAFKGSYNGGGSASLRKQMTILLDFMRSLPLNEMQPDDGIVVGGADSWRALSAPNQAYAVWFPGEGPIEPLVSLPEGNWRAEWINIVTGNVTSEAFVQREWVARLKGVRRGGGVALRIKKSDNQPSPFDRAVNPQTNEPIFGSPEPSGAPSFDEAADRALLEMGKCASGLGIGGVAIVAYFPGSALHSWSSKMQVFGRMKDAPGRDSKGANLIGIAYAKAAETADLLRNSGSGVRPPMIGEFGWPGAVITQTRGGYVLAAFSGGKSEDDVKVSQTGTEALKTALESETPVDP